MTYYIFGKIEERVIKFVGCTKNADIPADSVILQEVDDHPQFHWVKWSVRHRRTLRDKTALNHPLANYFTNPLRLKYVLGDADFERRRARENAAFLRFNQRHTEILSVSQFSNNTF